MTAPFDRADELSSTLRTMAASHERDGHNRTAAVLKEAAKMIGDLKALARGAGGEE